MESIVVGSFRDWDAARAALGRLHAAGFHHEELSVLSVTPEGQGGRRPNVPSKAPEGALAGATLGGALGAVEGFAIAAILIPGIGPFLAAGPILAALGGLAAGAGAGGILGTMMGAGFPREDAEEAERALGRGEILVAIPATGRESEARSILEAAGGLKVHAEEVLNNERDHDQFASMNDAEIAAMDRRAAEITAAAAPSIHSGNVSPNERPTAAHNQQRSQTGTQVGANPYVPGVSNSHPVDPPGTGDEEDPSPAEGMTGLRNVIR